MNRLKNLPKPIKIIGGILGVCLVAYLGLSIYFMSHFFPRSTVNGVSAGGAAPQGVKERISDAAKNYSLTVVDENSGKEYFVDGAGLSLQTDLEDGKIEGMLSGQNGFLWPKALFTGKEYFSENIVTYDESALEQLVSTMEPVTTTNFIRTEDATYVFNGSAFEIKKEVYGTNIDRDAFLKALGTKIQSLQSQVGLLADQCYVQPSVVSDSKELTDLVDTLNAVLENGITYDLGETVETVPAETIAGWLSADSGFHMTVQEEPMREFVTEMASKYNTFGKPKTLTSSWGTTVTVPGGTYGWKIDVDGEVEQLKEDLASGEPIKRDFVYQYTANSHGENDYGNSYVEVNLSAQHMYLYVDGKAVLDSDFVSGNPSKGNQTHTGAYFILYCEKDAVLRGDNYATPVKYWMPFHGNEGLHDANWRSRFGGQIYRTGGSHGCVNLPPSVAETLFGYVSDGFPVLVYELSGTENARYEKEAAAAVDAVINSVGEVTLESEGAIANARAAYESLSDAEKAFVTALPTLEAQELRLFQLKQEETLGGDDGDDAQKTDDKKKIDEDESDQEDEE